MIYRIISLLLMFTLLANPLIAYGTEDKNTKTTESSKKVNIEILKEKLKIFSNDLLSADDVANKIEKLSDSDREYFASHPERLQMAGSGLTTEEFILGFLFLAATVTTIVILGNSNSWGR